MHHWFRQWLITWSAPSHYLNNGGVLLIGPLRTNFSVLFKKKNYPYISMTENALEKIVCDWRLFCLGFNVCALRIGSCGQHLHGRPSPSVYICRFCLSVTRFGVSQFRRRWFETPSPSLWRHCIVYAPVNNHLFGLWFTAWSAFIRTNDSNS